MAVCLIFVALHVVGKEGNQGLSEGVTENKLRPNNNDLGKNEHKYHWLSGCMHAYLGGKTLEECGRTFVLNQIFYNSEPTDLGVQVSVGVKYGGIRPTLDSKLAFWMRVFTTSSGAATVILATAPAMDAMKFCVQVALE